MAVGRPPMASDWPRLQRVHHFHPLRYRNGMRLPRRGSVQRSPVISYHIQRTACGGEACGFCFTETTRRYRLEGKQGLVDRSSRAYHGVSGEAVGEYSLLGEGDSEGDPGCGIWKATIYQTLSDIVKRKQGGPMAALLSYSACVKTSFQSSCAAPVHINRAVRYTIPHWRSTGLHRPILCPR